MTQHLPVYGRHQSEATAVGAMETAHAVAGLGIQAEPPHPQRFQPLPQFGPGVLRVIVHPVGIGIFAPVKKVCGREFGRVHDALSALKVGIDDGYTAAGHHRVSAIDRPDVDDLHFHAATSGFQCRGEPRDSSAYDDDIGALRRLRASG